MTTLALLSESTLRAQLANCPFGASLHLLDQTDSTNTVAQKLSEEGAPHGTLVVAEFQTAGRGRWERRWFSPPHQNLYYSLILRKLPEPNRISWLPLMVGVSLCKTIRPFLSFMPDLKWPNDIVANGRKLGGILCETRSTRNQQQAVILGIGLNVNISEQDFPEDIRETATSIFRETRNITDRTHLLISALNDLSRAYEELHTKPVDQLHEAYVARCVTLGHEIRVNLHGGTFVQGVACGIGRDGSLELSVTNAHSGFPVPTSGLASLQAGEVMNVR